MNWRHCYGRHCDLGWKYNEFLDQLIPNGRKPPSVIEPRNEWEYFVYNFSSTHIPCLKFIGNFLEQNHKKILDFHITFDNNEHWDVYCCYYTKEEKLQDFQNYSSDCDHFVQEINYGAELRVELPKTEFPENFRKLRDLFKYRNLNDAQKNIKCRVLINYSEIKEMILGEVIALMNELEEGKYSSYVIPVQFEYEEISKKNNEVTMKNQEKLAIFISHLYYVYRKIQIRLENNRYEDKFPDSKTTTIYKAKSDYISMNGNDFLKIYPVLKKLFFCYVDYIEHCITEEMSINEAEKIPGNINKMKCWLERLNNWHPIKVEEQWINWTSFYIVTSSRCENSAKILQKTIKFAEYPIVYYNNIDETYIENENNKKILFGFVNMEGAKKEQTSESSTLFELKCPEECTQDLRRWICEKCGEYVKIMVDTNEWEFLTCSCGMKKHENVLLTCYHPNHRLEMPDITQTESLKTTPLPEKEMKISGEQEIDTVSEIAAHISPSISIESEHHIEHSKNQIACVKTYSSSDINSIAFTIQDRGFIHIPQLVENYVSRTDIMGIDLGSTRCVLAVSRNREIQIVPFDNSSPGDLWTESVVSFDGDKPIIGRAAIKRLKTKPSYVIFDAKLLFSIYHRDNKLKQTIWPFKLILGKENQPYVELLTCNGLKEFSLAEINKIFLEYMIQAANEYQGELDRKKAVITVPRYPSPFNKSDPLISSTIEAAKLANIEIIDIIEETHADLLYYLSNEKYSEMVKPGMKVAIFDIGGGTCISRIYEISEYDGKQYATCFMESDWSLDMNYKCSGRSIDDIIIKELEKYIPENVRNTVKLRMIETAKKIKHTLSFQEKVELRLSEIDLSLDVIVEFTRKWFEKELNFYFNISELKYTKYKKYPVPCKRQDRLWGLLNTESVDLPLNDIDIVFLAGGTCRIPFIQNWIQTIFQHASIIMDEELEVVTAIGAAVHGLQVLNEEVKVYMKYIKCPIICTITKCASDYAINIYDLRAKNMSHYRQLNSKPIQKIVDELIAKYGGTIENIIIANDPDLELHELQGFKKDDFKKYDKLIYLATKEELSFQYYLKEEIEYSIGDLIIYFEDLKFMLYKCTQNSKKKVKWKKLDEREYKYSWIDFEYVERMFKLKINQVHVVFEASKEDINILYGSKLEKYGFKSVNFMKYAYPKSILLSRFLLSDPEVSILVKTYSSSDINSIAFTIQDRGFIHIPQLVENYISRTDIMGIDLGSTRCVLAVSRNREIQIVPFDNSSPGDLWTESVVSFDGDKPIIGRAAIKRLKTKPSYVIFDTKLLCNEYHWKNNLNQSIWPFRFYFNKDGQPYIETDTSKGPKEFSLAEINKIFLEYMIQAANEYQGELDRKQVVITVPRYPSPFNKSDPLISSTIEAAKLANIEIIDIIEEPHADLLYYMSNDKYSEMVKPGMKVAIFDIGGGTCISRIYEISEHDGKQYALCINELDVYADRKCSERTIEVPIIEKLEKSIPEKLKRDSKIRTLVAAKEIKYHLSFKEKIEFDLSEIHSSLNETVEFTRVWFEEQLKKNFNIDKFSYFEFEKYQLPNQGELRSESEIRNRLYPPFSDVNIVFLVGGACRIPFVQRWIEEQFPRASIFIDEELEIITATGAAVHALQILSEEVESYIKITESR